jgi:hypothetical protein
MANFTNLSSFQVEGIVNFFNNFSLFYDPDSIELELIPFNLESCHLRHQERVKKRKKYSSNFHLLI